MSACEVVFMLTKSADYFYDYEGMKRRMAPSSLKQYETPYEGSATKSFDENGVQDGSDVKRRMVDKQRGHSRRHDGFNDRWDAMEREEQRLERAFRNNDLFLESLTGPAGAVLDHEGMIVALDVATQPFRGAHFATFPPRLIKPLIMASTRQGDRVLDPFGGAGTTGLVADRLGRNATLIELNPTYFEMARSRVNDDAAPLFEAAS